MLDQINHDQVVDGIGLPPGAEDAWPRYRPRGATRIKVADCILGNREPQPEAVRLPERHAREGNLALRISQPVRLH
jgi:hypothetical protein